jgi:hypothetical protein
MAWLCLRNDDYQNSQMCVVTDPNIDIAIKLIKRMKALFEPKLGITFDSKETVLELNGCIIEAYPSNHIDAYRALDNPKFILLDESDFFRKGEQDTEDKREKIQALSLAKDCYSMKLDLLTNATVVDDAIRFVSEKSKEKQKSLTNSNKDEDQREEKLEEQTREITTATTNQVF